MLPRMIKKRAPAARAAQFNLRLSDQLRDRIDAESQRNHRSMNSEIVARVEASLNEQDSVFDLLRSTQQTVNDMRESVQAIERHLGLNKK